MPKSPDSVAGGAMPADGQTTRRLFIAAGTAAAVCASIKRAAASTGDDDEIIALSTEILRLHEIVEDIGAKRVEPFEDEFQRLVHQGDRRLSREQRFDAAFAFSQKSGRDKAIHDQNEINGKAVSLFERLTAIPATTQAGRAAKVRVLLVYVLGSEWRGTAAKIDDWAIEQARSLLGEFAGMSDEELADV
jgi:hypothetical protein